LHEDIRRTLYRVQYSSINRSGMICVTQFYLPPTRASTELQRSPPFGRYYFPFLLRVGGWVGLSDTVVKVPRWCVHQRWSVTHPSTNQFQHRVTLLIETSVLPLSHANVNGCVCFISVLNFTLENKTGWLLDRWRDCKTVVYVYAMVEFRVVMWLDMEMRSVCMVQLRVCDVTGCGITEVWAVCMIWYRVDSCDVVGRGTAEVWEDADRCRAADTVNDAKHCVHVTASSRQQTVSQNFTTSVAIYHFTIDETSFVWVQRSKFRVRIAVSMVRMLIQLFSRLCYYCN